MKTDGTYAACIAVALVMGMNIFCVSSLAADELKGLKAPASPESLWQPPDMEDIASVLKAKAEPEAYAQKKYELAELIDPQLKRIIWMS